MLGSERIRPFQPVVVSAAHAFATIVQSDFGGRRTRDRLVLRGGPIPEWLRLALPEFPRDGNVVVAARGRAPSGSTTRISSIVIYPTFCGEPAQAFVYVEEWDTGLRTGEPCSPFHVVHCARLPELVSFVEVSRERRAGTRRPPGRVLLREGHD
jgi:hypothetical protein